MTGICLLLSKSCIPSKVHPDRNHSSPKGGFRNVPLLPARAWTGTDPTRGRAVSRLGAIVEPVPRLLPLPSPSPDPSEGPSSGKGLDGS